MGRFEHHGRVADFQDAAFGVADAYALTDLVGLEEVVRGQEVPDHGPRSQAEAQRHSAQGGEEHNGHGDHEEGAVDTNLVDGHHAYDQKNGDLGEPAQQLAIGHPG